MKECVQKSRNNSHVRGLLWVACHGLLLTGILFSLLSGAGEIVAAVIHVPADSTTIQSAIDGAADGDTVLVDHGVFTENIDFLGKSILVKSLDSPENTTINGGGIGSVVTFSPGGGPGCALEGFSITGGYNEDGGGIYADNAVFSLRGNVLHGNSALNYGGGMFLCDSDVVIEDTVVDTNEAYLGGGIYFHINCDLQVIRSIVSANTAYRGAGIFGRTSVIALESCSISGNTTDLASGPGGIYLKSCYDSSIRSSIIQGNQSAYAGGIFLYSSSVVITNNVICGNVATGDGGGIRCEQSSDSLAFNVIWGNDGNQGAGVYCFQTDIALVNNIISSNLTGYGLFVDDATNLSNSYNVLWNNAAGEYGGYASQGEGELIDDPMFRDELEFDFHLDPLSPCVNAGDPDSLFNDRNGTLANIGAYGGPAGGGVWIDFPTGDVNHLLIQPALTFAIEGDTVRVLPGTYRENIDLDATGSGRNVVLQSVQGPDSTVIAGLGDDAVVAFGIGQTQATVLDGFTITGGAGRAWTGGGGIYCYDASPIIRGNVITGNVTPGELRGGGIYCLKSDAQIIDNVISENQSFSGGGIYSGNSTLTVRSNVISDNLAENGAGIYSDFFTVMTINGNVLIGNVASSCGGGIYCNQSSPLIEFNTMDRNAAAENCGGGICCSGSSSGPLIFHNIVVRSPLGGGIARVNLADPELDFNCVWGNYGGDYIHCYPGERDISADPFFEKDPGNFYSLAIHSPCLDAGDLAEPIPPQGGPRIDLGALEYQYPEEPDLAVTITDIPDSVQTGTTLEFDIFLENLSEDVLYFDGWVEASGPLCQVIRSMWNIRIPGATSVPYLLSFPLPLSVPDGIYTLKVRVGNDGSTIESSGVADVVVWSD